MSEIDVGALSAQLDQAMESDGIDNIAGMPESPGREAPLNFANDDTGQAPQQAATPEPTTPEPVAPAEAPAQADSFAERFDPNSLPPELQPAYRLMQADYTRKRQQDAEAVRLYQQVQEQGIDLDAAAQLYQTVQSPDGLLTFVQEASRWLESQGLAEFEDPSYEYGYEEANPPQAPASPDLAGSLQSLVQEDPSMAPLAEAVQAMQARLDQFEQGAQERLAAEREEQAMLQAMGELQRQENIIRSTYPTYTDEDVDDIYALSAYFDGDLMRAQEAFEQAFTRRLGRYMGTKEAQPTQGVAPMGGAPAGAAPAELDYDPLNLKDAHQAAMETLRLIESQPEA